MPPPLFLTKLSAETSWMDHLPLHASSSGVIANTPSDCFDSFRHRADRNGDDIQHMLAFQALGHTMRDFICQRGCPPPA